MERPATLQVLLRPGGSYHPAISGDGRYLAFVSEASNLTPDSRGGVPQVYVSDLETGVTDLISRTPAGRPANGASARPVLSRDGSMVAYQSVACDLLCQGECRTEGVDINLLWDVFLHDRTTRRTIRASSDDGEEWLENSRAPSLDAAGGGWCSGRVIRSASSIAGTTRTSSSRSSPGGAEKTEATTRDRTSRARGFRRQSI
jgi:Tol biopolymer transport system component